MLSRSAAAARTAEGNPRGVALRNISKAFPGTQALDDVSLEVLPGTVHALCGANGSGKSTLVKVLTGVYQPEHGVISVAGREVTAITSPAEAARLGFRVVHQEAPLIDTFTVAECVALFRQYPTGVTGRIHWDSVREAAQQLLDRLDIPVRASRLCGSLGPAERAMVSMAIAIGSSEQQTNLLVLDEATAAIPEDDAHQFLNRVRRIAESGVPVLMVTHRVSEVPAIADRVTVLAGGRVVHAGEAAGLDEEHLIRYMIQGDPQAVVAEAVRETGGGAAPVVSLRSLIGEPVAAGASSPALEVRDLRAGALDGISFTVAPGEIVGVAGLADSGVHELPRVLSGAMQRSGGTIAVAGRELPRRLDPKSAIRSGIALVPADRLRQGGIATLSLQENIVLPQFDRLWHRGEQERSTVRRAIEVLHIHPPRPEAVLAGFSGGNQQKAIIGKWLLMRPQVLVLDDPTYGVDPQARQAIFRILHEASHDLGMGILFLSTEPEQLVLMSSRILVLRRGTIATTLSGSEMTRENVARWSTL